MASLNKTQESLKLILKMIDEGLMEYPKTKDDFTTMVKTLINHSDNNKFNNEQDHFKIAKSIILNRISNLARLGKGFAFKSKIKEYALRQDGFKYSLEKINKKTNQDPFDYMITKLTEDGFIEALGSKVKLKQNI